MMQLQVSPHVAATLISRLCRPRQSPMAQAAERHERAFRRVFLTAIAEARDVVPMKELEDALSMGHPGTGAPLYVMQPVFDMLLEKTKLPAPHEPHVKVHLRAAEVVKKTLSQAYLDAMTSGGRAGIKGPFVGMRFDATSPEAIKWAEDHAAELVTDVTVQARLAIRAVVVESFEEGVGPRVTARIIRQSIGLTERNAVAVVKRYVSMIKDGVASDVASSRADRYADKLTRSRAETIARTETLTAAHEGQRELWREGLDEGLLTGRERRVWIATDGACPICEELDGETAPLDGSYPGEGGDGPPAHPNCRCSEGLQ